MCSLFGKRVWLEKITCNWGISLKEGKMRSLLPCFPEDPSTPHCSRPTSPRAAWSPPSAPRPPRSTCRAECRCTPQPPASSRGDTRTRCIFRPIILWSCYHFSNNWVMLLFCSRQRQGKCVGLKVKEGLGGLLLSQATNKSQQGVKP